MRLFASLWILSLASCASAPPPPGAVPETVSMVSDAPAHPLSARDQKYLGYYKKIRGSLERAWKEAMKSKLREDRHAFDPEMSAGAKSTASIVLAIAPDGSVKSVRPLDPAHHLALYETVTHALANITRFDPPPAELVDAKTGEAKVRWDFVLQR